MDAEIVAELWGDKAFTRRYYTKPLREAFDRLNLEVEFYYPAAMDKRLRRLRNCRVLFRPTPVTPGVIGSFRACDGHLVHRK